MSLEKNFSLSLYLSFSLSVAHTCAYTAILSLTPSFSMFVCQCIMSEKDQVDNPLLSLSIVSDSILRWGQYHSRPEPFQYWGVCL